MADRGVNPSVNTEWWAQALNPALRCCAGCWRFYALAELTPHEFNYGAAEKARVSVYYFCQQCEEKHGTED